MQRLGRNRHGYAGEIIDLDSIYRRCSAAASAYGWAWEVMDRESSLVLPALHRAAKKRFLGPEPQRIYLSTGIHGDEPAGPLAICRLLEENNWPDHASLWICPLLNPSGLSLNRRENARGVDLNRDYLDIQSEEVRMHVAWLQSQPAFDLAFCLHEDWESNGFYLYELNPDNLPSLAEPMIDAVRAVCPIDLAEEIEGRAASGGIIRPSVDPRSRPQWPEAFWLLNYKTRLSYTLEAPSDFPMATRVDALVAAVRTAVQSL